MTINYLDSKRIVTDEYKVHKFTSGGTFTVTGTGNVEYLVVAGGGAGGGNNNGGGGGAGGFRTGTGHAVTAQGYTITVGAGGTGNSTAGQAPSGGDSTFSTITSTGGGGGGGGNSNEAGSNGGSGGGAAYTTSTSSGGSGNTPSRTPSQGNDGGNGSNGTAYGGGGGGGSGSAGVNATTIVGGNGGTGTSSPITGTELFYSGGGGGGSNAVSGGSSGSGGSSIGGNGAYATGSVAPTNGSTNTGSGGGGCQSANTTGGNGGSGIVIIRYLTSSDITATGGTITTVTDAKPTNVQDNSILVEKDTGRRYWFDEATPTTYTADYDDTNTWTKTGTKTTVNETVSGKVNWNFSSNYTSAENHVETTPLGFTLDNEKWVCDFEFNASAFDNAAENFLVVMQENAGDFISTSGDALACGIYANKSLRLWKKDGSSHSIYGTGITIALTTDYYARMTRTLATAVKLELFTSEADRTAGTNHVSGSPITYTFSETIQGLDNLTHCGRSDNVGATRTYNVSLDNLKIYNAVTSVTPATWTGNIDLTGLKSYYNFEQTSTTLTNMATSVGSTDSLGSSGDATGSGTITKGATGIIGNAWDFGGGKVTTSHQLIPTSGYWTYSTWVSLDDISTAGEEILRHESPEFEVWRNSGGLNVSGASGTINIEPAGNLANGTWYNIVLVHSSSGDISYLNGVSKSTADIISVPTGTSWYLGGRASSSEAINGKIDETIVWSRALSSSEVSGLYNSGRGKIVY